MRVVRASIPLLLFVFPVFGNDNPDPAAVERGRAAFVSSCGFCHGNDATGNRAPDLVRSVLVNRDEGGNLIAPVIKNGRPNKEMPAFPALSGQQVSDIVTFLHARIAESIASNKVSNDYPLSRLLTGNAAKGKAFFNGAGGCKSCHSPAGDLAGIAGKYSPVELQSRFLYPRRAAAGTVTVKTRSGQTFEGPLEHIDEFDIEMKDKAGWNHSWPRSSVEYTVHDPLARHRELLAQYTDAQVHDMFAYLETLH